MHGDSFSGRTEVVDLPGDRSGDGEPTAASVLEFGID